MNILDTNVVSELMRPEPYEGVATWVDAQPVDDLFVTSITQAEVLHGVLLLPKGKRRLLLERAATSMFAEDFAERILPFGSDAARAYAEIAADRRRAGKPISHFDAQIAAIARISGALLVTRNVNDFAGCGIRVFDPWTAESQRE
jgi:predicted nucleic acid-binding protein